MAKVLRAPKIDATTMTAMQELASAWIFKRAIQDNIVFKSAEDILEDKVTYDEVLKIYKDASKGRVKTIAEAQLVLDEGGWVPNFYKQNARLLIEIGKPKFTVFTRGATKGYTSNWYKSQNKSTGTFMEWVSDYVKNEFKIARKDNWDPADVWLIMDEKKHRKRIMEAMKGPTRSKRQGAVEANLTQFNDIFRELFLKKQIMGISLKKVANKKNIADWKVVNVTEDFFTKIEAIEMEYKSSKCKFGPGVVTEKQAERGRRKLKLNTTAGVFSLETQETMIELEDTANNVKYEIQIKANDNSKFDNLKYEPKDKGSSSARLGKATGEYVDDLVEFYGIRNWKRRHQDYPKNQDEFDEEQQKNYLDKIQFLQRKGVDIGKVTPEEAIINISKTFSDTSQPQTAQSKLMQVTWLYNLLTLTVKNRNKFLTDMIYLSEKAGRRFGPYAKLY